MSASDSGQGRGDLYACLGGGVALVLHALLAPAPAGLFQGIAVALGIALLVLPGYSLGRLLRLDRYGVAPLAGLALPFSLALLTVSATAVWLIAGSFAPALLEGIMGGLTLLFSGGALAVSRGPDAAPVPVAPSWVALGVLVVPLALAAAAITLALPVSPATRYTEFALVTRQPALTVAITNAEGQAMTYYVVAEAGPGQVRSAPIGVDAGARWTGPVTLPPAAAGLVRLLLYRADDSTPYRSLWANLNE